jgi:hypothetical protein
MHLYTVVTLMKSVTAITEWWVDSFGERKKEVRKYEAYLDIEVNYGGQRQWIVEQQFSSECKDEVRFNAEGYFRILFI